MTGEEIDAYTKALSLGSLTDIYQGFALGLMRDTNRQIVKHFALEEESIERTLAHVRKHRAWRYEFDTPLDHCLTHATYIQCCILESRGLVRRLSEGDSAVRFIPR